MARIRLSILVVLTLVLVIAYIWAPSIIAFYYLLRLPFTWHTSSALSTISKQTDQFDLTFSSYGANYSTEDVGLRPLIPAKLHHIHLGSNPTPPNWLAARAECLNQHSSWEHLLWNDDNSPRFVKENYPHLYDMWKDYPFVVQRIDALRYMVLEKHGGAVLDFDLICKRPLEPLRQFDFVAPAAHPAGFSIGMMLASPNNSFVKALVNNLPMFNHVWPFLPYATVMFSTGCHYASTVYTLQTNRSSLRILSGTPEHPSMHMLNGFVDTPLFRHLGSSSWHTKDARLVLLLKDIEPIRIFFFVVVIVAALVTVLWLSCSAPYCSGPQQDVESYTDHPRKRSVKSA